MLYLHNTGKLMNDLGSDWSCMGDKYAHIHYHLHDSIRLHLDIELAPPQNSACNSPLTHGKKLICPPLCDVEWRERKS